jgi:hypothetical protein
MVEWRSTASKGAAALVAVVCLVGCSGGDAGGGGADDSPVITLKEKVDAWPAALIEGRLDERGGCLLIGDEVAVFPTGTGWEAPEVVFDDGTRVAVGSQVSMGGGVYEADAATLDGLSLVPGAKVEECASRNGVTGFVWARP